MTPEEDRNDDDMEFDFETVDERSSADDSEPADSEQSGQREQEAETEAAGPDVTEEAAAQMMAELDIYAVLRMMIGMVAEQAWISLGLRVPKGAEEPKMDLEQARVAIDTLEFITEKLEPQLEEEEHRELKTLISNLQMNFVQRS